MFHFPISSQRNELWQAFQKVAIEFANKIVWKTIWIQQRQHLLKYRKGLDLTSEGRGGFSYGGEQFVYISLHYMQVDRTCKRGSFLVSAKEPMNIFNLNYVT